MQRRTFIKVVGQACAAISLTPGAVGAAAEGEGPVAWVTKEPNADDAPFYVKGAVAANVLGAASIPTTDNRTYSRLAFTLSANGAIVRLFVRAEHTKNAPSPLAAAQATARDITEAGIAEIYSQNKVWWKEFWLRSYIKLGDDLQKYWYNHYRNGQVLHREHGPEAGHSPMGLGGNRSPYARELPGRRERRLLHRARNLLRGRGLSRSLGAIRFLYREIIAASIELGRDTDRRAHWQDILDHMSPYPLQAWENTVTFRPDWVHDVMEALSFNGGARNTGLMFTTTFDNISDGTLPAYKIATCRTLDKGNMFYPQRWCGWQNGNDFGMMFVMAVRAGYRPDRVIRAIKGWKPEPNGIVSQKDGGGIETVGIIEAINNMLLQSHDGVIRIFPNWDQSLDAEFKRLRAMGAFLVEARYRASGQVVDSVRIFSEKGHPCVLQSPFDGDCFTVTRADNQQPVATVQNEETFTFHTTAGVTYEITRIECAKPVAGAPVITGHPASSTVAFPAKATFSVAASGKGLRYQWQKNRIDIPGATSEKYTTPATSLYDIGSAYRCVVSNSFGTARSNPGILNPHHDSPKEARFSFVIQPWEFQ